MCCFHVLNRFVVTLFLVVGALSGGLQGCVSSGKMGSVDSKAHDLYYGQKDPVKALEYYEKKIGKTGTTLPLVKLEALSAVDHELICELYGDQFDFTNYDTCINSYFGREDVRVTLKSSCTSAHSYYDTLPIRNDIMRVMVTQMEKVQVEMYRNNFPEAVRELQPLFDLENKYDHCDNLHYNTQPASLPSSLALAGTAYALNGETKNAESYLRKIDDHFSSSAMVQYLNPAQIVSMRNNYKIPILMALKRYQKTYDLLTDPEATENRTAGQRVVDDISNDAFKSLMLPFSLLISIPSEVLTQEIFDENYHKFFNIAKCQFETGHFAEAKKVYLKLLDVPSVNSSGSMRYTLLHDLARIEYHEGNNRQGLQYLKDAVEVIESQRSTLSTEAGKIGFVGDKQQVYIDLVDRLVQNGDFFEAFEYAERGKSRALVDMLASKTSIGSGEALTQSSALLHDLRLAEEQAVVSVPAAGKVRKRSAVQQQKQEIINTVPEVASLVSVTPAKASQIQSMLSSDETLLEFFGGADKFFAFVVTQGEIVAIPIDQRDIAADITELRKEFLNFASIFNSNKAKKLYNTIFFPVVSHLNTQKITIVAHGPLHYLPFNALHDGDSFLIDKYSIRMLPSASVMEFLGKKSKRDDSMLLLANPDLGDAQYDLPAAEQEGQAIAKGKNRINVLSRKAATETALRKYGATTSRLHIASHGQFKAEEPLKSRLLLAGDSENDGNLTVNELYNLELNNDLVVLSACETGLGDVKNGDDVIGLTRGFLFAGADSIVSSLWVVDDTATANLMVSFYDGLENNSKQEALRQAQLKIKNEYNEHPFFWAAFQLTGSI